MPAPATCRWSALVLLATAAALSALGFIAHQHRAAKPLLNLALFRRRSFAMASLVAFIYGMALFGSTYLVPVFMQLALQLPPSQAGAVLLPAGVVLAITIPLAGRLCRPPADPSPGDDRPAAARPVVRADAERGPRHRLVGADGSGRPSAASAWASCCPRSNLGAMRGTRA